MEELQQILEGCKRNDRAYQEKLYRKFYPALYALCRNFFSDKHDILTALNNGMLNVFINLKQYDSSKGDFFNWVYTVVRNSALTLVRDTKVVYNVELNDCLRLESQDTPLTKLIEGDMGVYLGELPPATRAVCCLFYIEGFSVKEIAASLTVKEGTVKWHLSEGREKLKSVMQYSKQI